MTCRRASSFYSICSYGSGHLAAAGFERGQIVLTEMHITVVLVLNPKAGGIFPQEKMPRKVIIALLLPQSTEQ